jgi:dolichyl-phosphate beta-glucosyltransferase
MAAFLRDLGRPYEVLVIVERSTDGTLDIAARFAVQQAHFQAVDNLVQRGKGCAVRSGMLRARGEFIFYMDADLSVPLSAVPEFLARFEREPRVDVLLGNRQHSMSRITRRQSWLRRTMGQTFNRILKGWGLASLHDTQCGFKAFRRAAARDIFSRQTLDGFAFDVEVLLLAEGLGCPIADLPVEWINSPESKVRIVRDSWHMLRDTLRVRRLVAQTLGRAAVVVVSEK